MLFPGDGLGPKLLFAFGEVFLLLEYIFLPLTLCLLLEVRHLGLCHLLDFPLQADLPIGLLTRNQTGAGLKTIAETNTALPGLNTNPIGLHE